MIHACIANQDRPLCDPMARLSVSRTLVHRVLVVKAATGTVNFQNLVTHTS